jgi:hypothetical protein
MIDAMNFVRPISRCDIQQDPRLVKMRCSTKPGKKIVNSKSINCYVDIQDSPRNTSGYFWHY